MGGGGAGHYQSGELRVGRDQEEGAGLGEGVAMVTVELGAGLQHHPGHALYYVCVREAGSSSYTHQGHHKQVTVETRCYATQDDYNLQRNLSKVKMIIVI